jgi:hypothetical protein
MFGRTGALLLCVSNLPHGVSRKDLKQFVRNAATRLRGESSRPTPAVIDCTIVRLTNPHDGRISHDGLVSIKPAKLALTLIAELQRTPLRGRFVKVCRYRHGSSNLSGRVETKTISDLLRGSDESDPATERLPMKVDLVSSTGPSPRPRIPLPETATNANVSADPESKSTQASDSNPREADNGSVFAH